LSGTIKITGGKVGAKSLYGPGIAGGTVIISVDQSKGEFVRGWAGDSGAGITGNNIIIESGEVSGRGGGKSGGGAGIGGNDRKDGGNVTIKGGTVEAIGCNGGAGIGGGNAGNLTGTITISGGTVTAKGGARGAGIGAGSAGNALKGHVIITGGKVIAEGNELAAGIGGGMEGDSGVGGEGSNVSISGTANVIAWAGGIKEGDHCSAIGHGHDDREYGTLKLSENMMVQADWNEKDGEAGEPFPWDNRQGGCFYRWYAHIQPCDHRNATYTDITGKTHTVKACKYCKQGGKKEKHDFNPKTHKCRTCGYEQKTDVTVTFDANGGKGKMGKQVLTPGEATKLNANAFTWEGHTFKGWNNQGRRQRQGLRRRGEDHAEEGRHPLRPVVYQRDTEGREQAGGLHRRAHHRRGLRRAAVGRHPRQKGVLPRRKRQAHRDRTGHLSGEGQGREGQ